MQEQFKYIVDGKVVDRKDFNKLFKNKYIHIEGDNIYAIDFSSVSNLFDGDFKSSRQINDHLKDILELGQIKGSSTRHKSQNGETHVEKELEFKSISKYNIKGRGDVILVKAKSKESLLGKEVLIDGERYKVKGVETQGYLETGKEIGLLVSKIAEKENKTEENLVFQKDSEIHKDDVITNSSRGEKETMEYLQGMKESNGKKTNKNKPEISLLFKQFPKALEAIVMCSQYGHEKYKETDKDYLNYTRVDGGSKTYADAGLRHRLQQGKDLESGLPHQFHVAWNALAELELWIKENYSQ